MDKAKSVNRRIGGLALALPFVTGSALLVSGLSIGEHLALKPEEVVAFHTPSFFSVEQS